MAHVALDQTTMMTENGPVPLGPGMKVTAEIKTGKRTVISYLLSPVFRYRQESLRERSSRKFIFIILDWLFQHDRQYIRKKI